MFSLLSLFILLGSLKIALLFAFPAPKTCDSIHRLCSFVVLLHTKSWRAPASVRSWQALLAHSLISLWTQSFSASWVHQAQTATTSRRRRPDSSVWLLHPLQTTAATSQAQREKELKPHLSQAGCHASPINCMLAKCIFCTLSCSIFWLHVLNPYHNWSCTPPLGQPCLIPN